MKRAGLNPDASSQEALRWLASRRPLDPRADELMRRRAAGESVSQITRDLGLPHHARVQGPAETAFVRLLAAHLEAIELWGAALASGAPAGVVAREHDVEPWIISTALGGWPDPTPVSPDEQRLASALWRAGEDTAKVANSLGWSRAKLDRMVAAQEVILRPGRVRQADLGRRYGWSPSLAKNYRRAGVVPPPDSPRDSSATWWWDTTLVAQVESNLVHACRECNGRFATGRGLAIHRASRHGDRP